MRNVVLRAVVGALLLASCNDDDGPGPRIDRVAPPQARVGDLIDILGERFCGLESVGGDAALAGSCENAFVTFGTADGIEAADADTWTGTRITVRVPQLVRGPTSIVVTVSGRQSGVADFEVIE